MQRQNSLPGPNHSINVSVAIPDSALSDESLKIDKTRKVSVLARACAIFRVQTIYIYRDGNRQDGEFMSMILRYLDTPQFLRRRLYPKINDLKFAGVLHPLKIPSHVTPADPKKIQRGDIREGVIIGVKGERFVDVGINKLVRYNGKARMGARITVQFKEALPKMEVKEIGREQIPAYWGYRVRERADLFSLLQEWQGDVVITSRKGKPATRQNLARYASDLLLVFGSPQRGVDQILGGKKPKVQNARTLDFFPGQATQTVRLEEALLGVLAIINHT